MIDIIIPTYRRAERIAAVARNAHEATTTDHRVWFVVELDDEDSIHAADDAGEGVIVNLRSRNYAGAMNAAYERLDSDWLFAGADDLEFFPGWDAEILARVDADNWFGIYGTNDLLNPYVLAGHHATHYLVARWYLDDLGGTVDGGPGSFMHEGYGHNYTDTELIGTAKARSRFRPVLLSIVRHLHQSAGLTPHDATHVKAEASYGADSELYDLRRPLWQNLSR